MNKYLYLSEEWHCEAWVNGGVIPIKLASTYLSNKRSGILTPDETLIHRSEFPVPRMKEFGMHFQNVKGITVKGCTYNGKKIPNITNAQYYNEDGLILSFCNIFSPDIARRLGKVACVEILDINKLQGIINKELGCKAFAGNCKYTKNHERNHFLKSTQDEWQQEYRLFWNITSNKEVSLPQGLARIIPFTEK